jgi:glutamate racemase
VLKSIVGPDVTLVDSAVTTAKVVAEMLSRAGVAAGNVPAPIRLLATDAPDRFARVAANFLPFPITAAMVELVDLQQAGVKVMRSAPAFSVPDSP